MNDFFYSISGRKYRLCPRNNSEMLEYKRVGYIKSISCFQVNKNVCLLKLKGVLNPSIKTEMHDQNQHTTLKSYGLKSREKPVLLGQKKTLGCGLWAKLSSTKG